MNRIALLFVAALLTSLASAPDVTNGQDFPSTGAGSFGPAIQIPEAVSNALPGLSSQGGASAAASAQSANAPQQLFGKAYGDVFTSPNQFSTGGVRGYQTVIESAPPEQYSSYPAGQQFSQAAPTPAQATIQSVSPVQSNQPVLQYSDPGQQVFESVEVAPPSVQVSQPSGEFVQYAEPQYVPAQMEIMEQDSGCQSCGCADGSCDYFAFEDSQFPTGQAQRQRRPRRAKRSCSECSECSRCCSGCDDCSAAPAGRGMRQARRTVGRKSGGFVYSTAGVSALLFNRNHGNNVDFATNGGDLLSSNNAVNDVLPGIDAFISRRRTSGRGWEARYFGLYPTDQSVQIGNNARTLLPGLNQVGTTTGGIPPNVFLPGPTAANFFDLGDTHVLTRQTELNNVEINLLRNSQPRLRALSTEFLFGIRYFQFGETLLYEAVDLQGGDPQFGSPESIGYFSSVENNLLGFQVGARSDYKLRDRLMLHVGGKIGAYNNTVNTRQRVDYRLNNGSVINPFVRGSGQRFDVGANDEVKSILGEVDVSLSYQLSSAARVRAGYRALGVTDIAFASNQIQDDFTETAGSPNPITNDEFVLQGAYVGLEFAY